MQRSTRCTNGKESDPPVAHRSPALTASDHCSEVGKGRWHLPKNGIIGRCTTAKHRPGNPSLDIKGSRAIIPATGRICQVDKRCNRGITDESLTRSSRFEVWWAGRPHGDERRASLRNHLGWMGSHRMFRCVLCGETHLESKSLKDQQEGEKTT
jgi:hypothetical protein